MTSAAEDFSTSAATQLLHLGKERTEAMLNMQKALLGEYEEASQVWLGRVKSEVDLWSQLAKTLSGIHSVPEGMDAYRDCVSQRMLMAVDDGKILFEEGQKIIGTVTRSLAKNWSSCKTK